MVALVLDTASPLMVVALVKDGRVLYLESSQSLLRQAERLAPAVDQALRANGLQVADLDAVYVGEGPGSYTGTRVALTLAKTIAYAQKIDLYSFSSLLLSCGCRGQRIATIQVGRRRCYYGVFSDGVVVEEGTIEEEAIPALVQAHPGAVVGPGDDLPTRLLEVIKTAAMADPMTLAPRYL